MLLLGPGPGAPKIGPKEAGIGPPGSGESLGFWSPDRQAEVGDRFGHPQGVQVNALNSEFWFRPSNEPLSKGY